MPLPVELQTLKNQINNRQSALSPIPVALETNLSIPNDQTPVGFTPETLVLNQTLETPTFSSLAFQMLQLAKSRVGIVPQEAKENLFQEAKQTLPVSENSTQSFLPSVFAGIRGYFTKPESEKIHKGKVPEAMLEKFSNLKR